MKTYINNRRSQKNKIVYISLACLLLAGLCAGILVYRHYSSNDKASTAAISKGINLDPPTAEDKAEAEQNKASIANELDDSKKDAAATSSQNKQTSGKINGNVAITSYSQAGANTRIAAMVSNVFEEGGTCTLTMASDNKTVTKQSSAFQNASYTQCMPFNIPSTEAPAGTYTATVTYESQTTYGQSAAQQLEVK